MEFISIYHHRNGITGNPFYAGEMRDEDGTYIFTQFVGDVSNTAVFRLHDGRPDMEHNLRGDYFSNAILEKIVEVTA